MPNNIDNDEDEEDDLEEDLGDNNPKAGNQNQKDDENMDIDLDF